MAELNPGLFPALARLLKRMTPRNLFGRALVIIVAPVLLLPWGSAAAWCARSRVIAVSGTYVPIARS